MKTIITICFIATGLFSCKNNSAENKTNAQDTIKSTARIKKDTLVPDGEKIYRYSNGTVQMRGIMTSGKRDGVWISFYENGLPWSETTFKDGIKNGSTTTWFETGNKRYEGFYTNDKESGKWTFWDSKGKEVNSIDYDKK